jgi:hypothetical protein
MQPANASSVPCAEKIPDRVLILGTRNLRAVLAEYRAHYHTARPPQSIEQRNQRDALRAIHHCSSQA